MAVRSEFRAELGLVLLQDFGLIVWSRAGGDEGMDRETEDAFSPGRVLNRFLESTGCGPSTTLLPRCSGRLQMAKIWRDWFSLKTSPCLFSKYFTFIFEGGKAISQLKTA